MEEIMGEKFKLGEKVQHKLAKEWVLVVSCHEDEYSITYYKCRTKQLELIEFSEVELEAIS